MTSFVAAMGLVIGVSTAGIAMWKGVGGDQVNTVVNRTVKKTSHVVGGLLQKVKRLVNEKKDPENLEKTQYAPIASLNEFQVYLFISEFFRISGQIKTDISPETKLSPFQLYNIVFKLIAPIHAKIITAGIQKKGTNK